MSESQVLILNESSLSQKAQESSWILVDFWAPWCGPCRAFGPTIEALAEEYKGKLAIGKLNVDENPNAAVNYGVKSIPYIALIREGKAVASLLGNQSKENLVAFIKEHTGI